MLNSLNKHFDQLDLLRGVVGLIPVSLLFAVAVTQMAAVLFDFELAWNRLGIVLLQILPAWLVLYALFLGAYIMLGRLMDKGADAMAAAIANRGRKAAQNSGDEQP